jgi:hypothetical protein
MTGFNDVAKKFYEQSLDGTLPSGDLNPGTGATDLGKAEDAAHTTGDVGVMILGVVTDGSTALTASGDYSVVGTDTAGNLRTAPSGRSASATFTPAASSHVANDCNGAAGTFALGAVSGSSFMITSATLEIDGATAEATAWTLHLYNVTPPSALADDAAFDLPSGDRTAYLGSISLGTAVDLGSTQWIEVHGINKQIKLSGTGVFGYLVNTITLTPAAVAHIVTLHGTM